MKNILIFFCLIGLFATPVFSQEFHPRTIRETSQKDTSFWGNVIIKINPSLLLSVALTQTAEYGGIIQVPFLKKGTSSDFYYNTDLFIGIGVDKDYESGDPLGHSPTGYTVRGGFYYFFNKKRKNYIELQYFFRKWSFINTIHYSLGLNTVLDPTSIIGSEGSDPDYRYNASIYVNCLDIIYGNQVPLFHSKHFIFDWYVGVGARLKIIDQTVLGYYHDGQYYPNTSLGYSPQIYHYPDPKLGFMIGYVL